jgi:site-specific DNA recombinase
VKRAAIYLRVSTSAQAKRNREPEGYSIPAQREACQRKAAALDAEVICEYVDRGESAKAADRPELRALLDDATISYALPRSGVELISVCENIDDTPFGRFMHAILSANAEFYSANLATEARKGLIQKAKSGGTPTRAPLGYLNVRQLIDGREIRTVQLDSDRAPHVRFAFAAYASGAYTLDTLQATLTERGLTTRATQTRAPRPLSRSQLAALLANPYYIGTVRYAGVEYDGRHEPLIDKHTFQRVQAVLAAHNHAQEKDRKHHHYLKGTIYCGRCGSRMSLIHAKGNGGSYPYFFCIARMKGTGCTQPYLPVDAVERTVERLYARVRLPRAHTEQIRQRLDHAVSGMRPQAEQEAIRQRRRLATLTDQREKLLHAYYHGAVPLDLLKAEQHRLAADIAQAEHHLQLAEQSTAATQQVLAKAIDLLASCQRAYRQAPGHLRRQWNQALFQQIVIHNDRDPQATLAEPFATLATHSRSARQERDAARCRRRRFRPRFK